MGIINFYKYRYFFLISIIFHVFFLITLKKYFFKVENNSSLHAYIYKSFSMQDSYHKRVCYPERSEGSLSHEILRYAQNDKATTHNYKATITHAKQNVKNINQQSIAENNNLQQRYTQLLQLLHTAIAKQQTYPDDAISLNQTGVVEVSFILSPDGNITSVKITKTSGFHALDQAAILSVKSIKPFLLAKNFLVKSGYFAVSIVYN